MATNVKSQIAEFLRFFDVKRDLYVAEAEHVVRDVKEARLYEDMYSKDDVEEIFGDVVAAIKERMRRDLETNASMAALVLEQLLSSAADEGVTIKLDMDKTEDEAALTRIRELNTGLASFGDADLKKKNVVKLESLRDEHQRLIADNSRLAEEAAALKERYLAMQHQASMLTQSKAELEAKLESADARLDAMECGAGAVSAASTAQEAEAKSLRAKVAELHSQMEAAKTNMVVAQKEREATLNSSKQFLMMRQMLTKKNAQLAELRGALKRYEPEKEEAADAVVSK